jgi:hypothetical protein
MVDCHFFDREPTMPLTAAQELSPQSAVHSDAGVRAALTFIRPQADKPVLHSAALTGAAPRFFFETAAEEVTVADLRPLAGALSLDREGFVLRKAPTAVADLYDDIAVESDYYREVEGLDVR